MPPRRSLRIEPAPDAPRLPDPAPARLRPLDGHGLLTGGGLVVAVSSERGLVGVWEGDQPLPLPEGLAQPAGTDARIGPGYWFRALSGGGEERGIVVDPFPVVVIQHTGVGGGTGPRTHLVVPHDLDPDTCRRLVPQLAAHALRRQDRGAVDAGFALSIDPGEGGWDPGLDRRITEALAVLDDAPLSDPTDPGPGEPEGRPRPPVLVAGTDGAGPLPVVGVQRVEIALGALAAGRWSLARALVDTTLSDREFPDAARLFLATRWALWTGEISRLRPHLGSLDEAAHRFANPPGAPGTRGPDALGVAGLPAAFPAAPTLLSGFADAVEPLGHRGWTDELRTLATQVGSRRAAGSAPDTPGAAGERTPRGLRLPVLGQGGGEATPGPGPRPAEPTLPPAWAFASPHHPSVAHRRTLHAARLLRSAVEGLVGARPDASYGRIALAPDLLALARAAAPTAPDRGLTQGRPDGPTRLSVHGLRLADARLDLDCRVADGLGTLRVSQVGGRVPVNVVFEPRMPLPGVRGVRLGSEPADVEIEELEGGVRLRFQFPLDPERRVSVDGTA